MALSDTAEYWQDVKAFKGWFPKHKFIHIKGVKCGHYHVIESNELDEIDCKACKKIIESDEELKQKLTLNNGKRLKKIKSKLKNKKGYKLDSIIKFGKFKGSDFSVKYLIHNEINYFNWFKTKFLLHTEVDRYINEITRVDGLKNF